MTDDEYIERQEAQWAEEAREAERQAMLAEAQRNSGPADYDALRAEYDRKAALVKAAPAEPKADVIERYNPPPTPAATAAAEEDILLRDQMAGYFQLSREIFNSDIWAASPAVLTVYLYIVQERRFTDSEAGRINTAITTIDEIRTACCVRHGVATAAVAELVGLGEIVATDKNVRIGSC